MERKLVGIHPVKPSTGHGPEARGLGPLSARQSPCMLFPTSSML